MLSFLTPLFLAGAAAATIPIVLHLLRREPEPRVKFTAVKLLKQAPVERTSRRHIRELLLLALRVATLLLLALAFARPFFARGAALGSTGMTIVAVDTSYSMSAPGRFARAQALAKAAVDRVPSSDLVGVLAFSDRATMIAAPSGDRSLASAAIDRLEPGFGSTKYRAALNAAAQSLEGRRGTIVVVTDLQESGWDAGDRAAVPDTARIEVADVGAVPANVAVASLRADGERVVATIRNAGVARDVKVRLDLDGRPAREVTASLPANGSAEVTLAAAGRARTATVSVDDPQGFQADNVRYAVLGANTRPDVLVVGGSGDLGRDAFYVSHALAAGDAQRASFQVTPVSGAALSAWQPGQLDAHTAVVILSTKGLERRGRETLARYVARGGGLLIAAGPEVDGAVASDALGADAPLTIAADQRTAIRALAPADVRHPVFRAFDSGAAALGLVRFRSVAQVAGRGCQTLARFTTGEPALIDCAAGDGHALVFASDLNNQWNDFPLHATFVPFLHEAVRYLGGTRPSTTDHVVGAEGLPDKPGFVQVPADAAHGGVAKTVAVNVDPLEADPARITVEEFESAVTRLKAVADANARVEASQQEDRQHLWQYVLVAMLLALGIEGVVASQTA